VFVYVRMCVCVFVRVLVRVYAGWCVSFSAIILLYVALSTGKCRQDANAPEFAAVYRS